MRDLVLCKWPLPAVSIQGTLFETASLGNEGRRYTITKEGHLLRHASEEVPEYKGPYFTKDLELPIHGDLHLTSRWTSASDPRLSVVVRFREGAVQWIKLAAEVGSFHDRLTRACKHLPGDYKPWGDVERDSPEAPQGWWADCASGCRYFLVLRDAGDQAISNDWGVCVNPRSHRVGLLTFEHQGCPAFEHEDADEENEA